MLVTLDELEQSHPQLRDAGTCAWKGCGAGWRRSPPVSAISHRKRRGRPSPKDNPHYCVLPQRFPTVGITGEGNRN